ncbi:MAG: hypothetical protein GW911_18510 [Armatimonadetes bacterium]|nr:hypothetical protein [Armatimonadota bacterium]NCO95115.1 hypothetical protein [Armatimonadota bacterium]NCP33302.1 hypothetical protein [Armatimonadota bacterium]NCQ27211.1 hypothetical protein [Armatimonadota bacterium]NDK14024.1 hypothetical protein [Armatimonadota bacterium]
MSTGPHAVPSQEALTDPVAQWTGPAVDTLAVFCSDGRFKQMVDQFLRDGLKIPNCDVFAVPGGAGWLTVGMFNHKECDVANRWLDALIQKHNLKRAVLLAHEDCAFYKEKCKGSSPLEIQKQQLTELHEAGDRLQRMAGSVQVELYYADIVDDHVTFKRVK